MISSRVTINIYAYSVNTPLYVCTCRVIIIKYNFIIIIYHASLYYHYTIISSKYRFQKRKQQNICDYLKIIYGMVTWARPSCIDAGNYYKILSDRIPTVWINRHITPRVWILNVGYLFEPDTAPKKLVSEV